MIDDGDSDGLRERLTRQGEDALGRLAQEILEHPLVNGAVVKALEAASGARDRAGQAQEVAFGALNLPSAADLERLTRRVRSVAQRLEGIEDGVDRLEQRLSEVARTARGDQRLSAIEEQLAAVARQLTDIHDSLGSPRAVPSGQERLKVTR